MLKLHKFVSDCFLNMQHRCALHVSCRVGFIRDAIVRGETHDAMDLDVGLPLTGMSPSEGMADVTKQAHQAGLRFVRNQASTDSRLCKAFFRTADGSTEFEVQVSRLTCLI